MNVVLAIPDAGWYLTKDQNRAVIYEIVDGVAFGRVFDGKTWISLSWNALSGESSLMIKKEKFSEWSQIVRRAPGTITGWYVVSDNPNDSKMHTIQGPFSSKAEAINNCGSGKYVANIKDVTNTA